MTTAQLVNGILYEHPSSFSRAAISNSGESLASHLRMWARVHQQTRALTIDCDGLCVLQDGIPSWNLHCDGIHSFRSKLERYASLQGDQGLKHTRAWKEGKVTTVVETASVSRCHISHVLEAGSSWWSSLLTVCSSPSAEVHEVAGAGVAIGDSVSFLKINTCLLVSSWVRTWEINMSDRPWVLTGYVSLLTSPTQ